MSFTSEMTAFNVKTVAARLATAAIVHEDEFIRAATAIGVPIRMMKNAVARARGETPDESPALGSAPRRAFSRQLDAKMPVDAPTSSRAAENLTPDAARGVMTRQQRIDARENFAGEFGPMSAETKRGLLASAEIAGKVPRLTNEHDEAASARERGAAMMARALGKTL